MAQVTVIVSGGSRSVKEANTVGELKQQLGLGNHKALVNDDPADDSTRLADRDWVMFSPAVKGGAQDS